jgi:hypothetical protein
VHDCLAQLLTACSGIGTGLQIRRKTTLAAKPLDALPADHQLPKALEWILALRVEDQHCKGGFVHVKLMDQAIIGLSGEVPEPDFPLDVIATSVVW